VDPAARSNYTMRHAALALRNDDGDPSPRPTAVLTHGANPGLVSHFLKQALLNIARDVGVDGRAALPVAKSGQHSRTSLGVKVVHVAERDTQVPSIPKKVGEFVNTWSVDGFISAGSQPAELGWGTHEKALPADGRTHNFGTGAAI
jgi:homospermidine synthase